MDQSATTPTAATRSPPPSPAWPPPGCPGEPGRAGPHARPGRRDRHPRGRAAAAALAAPPADLAAPDPRRLRAADPVRAGDGAVRVVGRRRLVVLGVHPSADVLRGRAGAVLRGPAGPPASPARRRTGAADHRPGRAGPAVGGREDRADAVGRPRARRPPGRDAPLEARPQPGRPGDAGDLHAARAAARPRHDDLDRDRHDRAAVLRRRPDEAARGAGRRRSARRGDPRPDGRLPRQPDLGVPVVVGGSAGPGLPGHAGAVLARRRRPVRRRPRPGAGEVGLPAQRPQRLHLRHHRRGARPGRRVRRAGAVRDAGLHRHADLRAQRRPVAADRRGHVDDLARGPGVDQHRVRRGPAAGDRAAAPADLLRRHLAGGDHVRVRSAHERRPARAGGGGRAPEGRAGAAGEAAAPAVAAALPRTGTGVAVGGALGRSHSGWSGHDGRRKGHESVTGTDQTGGNDGTGSGREPGRRPTMGGRAPGPHEVRPDGVVFGGPDGAGGTGGRPAWPTESPSGADLFGASAAPESASGRPLRRSRPWSRVRVVRSGCPVPGGTRTRSPAVRAPPHAAATGRRGRTAVAHGDRGAARPANGAAHEDLGPDGADRLDGPRTDGPRNGVARNGADRHDAPHRETALRRTVLRRTVLRRTVLRQNGPPATVSRAALRGRGPGRSAGPERRVPPTGRRRPGRWPARPERRTAPRRRRRTAAGRPAAPAGPGTGAARSDAGASRRGRRPVHPRGSIGRSGPDPTGPVPRRTACRAPARGRTAPPPAPHPPVRGARPRRAGDGHRPHRRHAAHHRTAHGGPARCRSERCRPERCRPDGAAPSGAGTDGTRPPGGRSDAATGRTRSTRPDRTPGRARSSPSPTAGAPQRPRTPRRPTPGGAPRSSPGGPARRPRGRSPPDPPRPAGSRRPANRRPSRTPRATPPGSRPPPRRTLRRARVAAAPDPVGPAAAPGAARRAGPGTRAPAARVPREPARSARSAGRVRSGRPRYPPGRTAPADPVHPAGRAPVVRSPPDRRARVTPRVRVPAAARPPGTRPPGTRPPAERPAAEPAGRRRARDPACPDPRPRRDPHLGPATTRPAGGRRRRRRCGAACRSSSPGVGRPGTSSPRWPSPTRSGGRPGSPGDRARHGEGPRHPAHPGARLPARADPAGPAARKPTADLLKLPGNVRGAVKRVREVLEGPRPTSSSGSAGSSRCPPTSAPAAGCRSSCTRRTPAPGSRTRSVRGSPPPSASRCPAPDSRTRRWSGCRCAARSPLWTGRRCGRRPGRTSTSRARTGAAGLRRLPGRPDPERRGRRVPARLHRAGHLGPARVREERHPADPRPGYVPVPYIERMDLAYAAADVVLGRSGMTTVAELTAVGLPAVYVPLPHGNGEQALNARPVVEAGGGKLVQDEDMNGERAIDELMPMLTDPDLALAMGRRARAAGHGDADERIARIVMEVAGRDRLRVRRAGLPHGHRAARARRTRRDRARRRPPAPRRRDPADRGRLHRDPGDQPGAGRRPRARLRRRPPGGRTGRAHRGTAAGRRRRDARQDLDDLDGHRRAAARRRRPVVRDRRRPDGVRVGRAPRQRRRVRRRGRRERRLVHRVRPVGRGRHQRRARPPRPPRRRAGLPGRVRAVPGTAHPRRHPRRLRRRPGVRRGRGAGGGVGRHRAALRPHRDRPARRPLLEFTPDGTGCRARFRTGDAEHELTLGVPGEHMALNALGAFLAGVAVGTDPAVLLEGLAGFGGVQRRFEFKGRARGVAVYDDYAHHPTEVAATLRAAREAAPVRDGRRGRVLVAFQPHLYSRTRLFAAEFGASLSLADEVMVLDVYGAREDPEPGVGPALITDAVTLPAGGCTEPPRGSGHPRRSPRSRPTATS
ncbi:hypothetical protein L7F22_048578 [Adiantum nelumboides]|nr:hypothetical protein [Adiantum nelumboides]